MSPEALQQWIPLMNIIGAPLVVLYAIHRGWLATKREIDILQSSYSRLLDRYETLEKQMQEEQLRMRQELELTRSQLIEILVDMNKETVGSH